MKAPKKLKLLLTSVLSSVPIITTGVLATEKTSINKPSSYYSGFNNPLLTTWKDANLNNFVVPHNNLSIDSTTGVASNFQDADLNINIENDLVVEKIFNDLTYYLTIRYGEFLNKYQLSYYLFSDLTFSERGDQAGGFNILNLNNLDPSTHQPRQWNMKNLEYLKNNEFESFNLRFVNLNKNNFNNDSYFDFSVNFCNFSTLPKKIEPSNLDYHSGDNYHWSGDDTRYQNMMPINDSDWQVDVNSWLPNSINNNASISLRQDYAAFFLNPIKMTYTDNFKLKTCDNPSSFWRLDDQESFVTKSFKWNDLLNNTSNWGIISAGEINKRDGFQKEFNELWGDWNKVNNLYHVGRYSYSIYDYKKASAAAFMYLAFDMEDMFGVTTKLNILGAIDIWSETKDYRGGMTVGINYDVQSISTSINTNLFKNIPKLSDGDFNAAASVLNRIKTIPDYNAMGDFSLKTFSNRFKILLENQNPILTKEQLSGMDFELIGEPSLKLGDNTIKITLSYYGAFASSDINVNVTSQ